MLTNAYCTVAELRTHINDTGSAVDLGLLERAVNAASRAIDRYCGRRFWQDATPQIKVYRPAGPCSVWTDDISTLTGLIIKTDTNLDGTFATTLATTDYQLEPLNANTEATAFAWWIVQAIGSLYFPWYGSRATIQVTARFGWSAVPDQVVEACVLKAAALLKRKDSPEGVAGFNEFGAVRITRADPDVMALLSPYRKVGV